MTFTPLLSKVSIGMTTCNSELTIKRAIESVISQSFQNWELIIVDANSSDNTIEIVKDFSNSDQRIHLIIEQEQQIWMKLSLKELEIATGDFFMWLDADDFISTNWIETLLKSFDETNEICSIGLLELIDHKGMLVINNLSALRLFKFTSSRFRLVRVSLYIMHPESFGLVNSLYGLWQIDELRYIRQITLEKSELRFDQIFLLNALKTGKIKYNKKTTHFRRTLSRKSKISGSSSFEFLSRDFIRFPRRIEIFEYLKCLLKDMPPIYLYFTWISRENFWAKPVYLSALLLRTTLAMPVYIAKFLIKKFLF